MKKCPYCKTFMNDDVNQCPNCLKDMSDLKSMPEVSPKGNKKSFNFMIYGGIISVGGALASLSQFGNLGNYRKKYDDIMQQITLTSDSTKINELNKEAFNIASLINDCEFRTWIFAIIAVVGLGFVIAGLIMLVVKLIKSKRKVK